MNNYVNGSSLKKMPVAIEAERNILASVVIDPRIIQKVNETLKIDDFYDYKHKLLFKAMIELHSEKIEIAFPVLIDKLTQNNTLEKVGGYEYIYDLVNEIPTSYYFDSYCDILIDTSIKREMIILNNKLMNSIYKNEQSTDEYIEEFQKKSYEISKRKRTTSLITVGSVAQEYYKKVESIRKDDTTYTGLDTGYYQLNKIINGLCEEELIIIAARPGVGKSAFAIQLAINVAKANKSIPTNKKIAFFSLEMSNQQLVNRLVSNIGAIDSNKLRVGNALNAVEWLKFNTAVQQLKKTNIYFDDETTISTNDIKAKCRKIKQEQGLDLIIIDYLQLLQSKTKSNSRLEEITKISRDLKQLAKELKVPVIALSQLSRSSERSEDKIPKLSHLRESGSIEQDADIVLFLHREDYYSKLNSEDDNKMSLIVAKNRQGISGVSIDFIFYKQETRFFENQAPKNTYI